MKHHLIFEGAEMAGKSWIMSCVYSHLEKKYGRSRERLDGCFWLNCDFGLFGSEKGKPVVKKFVSILHELEDENVLVEKFYLSDSVLSRIYRGESPDYRVVESELLKMGYKVVLVAFREDQALLEGRIQDRLNLYPHYARVARKPADYIKQQREYMKAAETISLPYITVTTDLLPDEKPVEQILDWIGEGL